MNFKYSLLLINAYPEAKEDMSQDFITYESTVTATDDDAFPAVQTQVRSIVQEEQYIRFAGFNISEDPQAVSGSASDGIQWSPSSLEAYKITKTDKSATNVSVYLGGAGNYGYETHGRSENEFLNSIQVKVGSSGNQATENTVPDLYNGLYVANHTRLSGARINVNVHMDPDNNSFFQYRFEAWLPNFGRRSDGLNLSDRDLENNPTRYAIKLRAIEPVYDEDGNPIWKKDELLEFVNGEWVKVEGDGPFWNGRGEYWGHDWLWRDVDGRIFAYTDREYFIYHFPQMLEKYIGGKKKDLGYQSETSLVLGLDFYHYGDDWWLHAWGNWLPVHFGHTKHSYQNASLYQQHLEEGYEPYDFEYEKNAWVDWND